MELTQESLNLDEKEIELVEEVNYNLVEKEKGSEDEYESALETAKTIFGLQNLQDIQVGERESDEDFHMLNNSGDEGDFVITDANPTKLSPLPLAWLFGTWEVDVSAGSDYDLYEYGYFFARGNNCIQHTWNIVGRNIQVPCLGLKSCSAFMEIHNVASNTSNEQRVRNICTKCFESCGGHLHIRGGSGNKSNSKLCVNNGMHEDDATLVLDLFANWISKVANSGNDDKKREITTKSTDNNISKMIPNPLLIKTAMKLNSFDSSLQTEQRNPKVEDYKKFGEEL
ncbi:846_t:CDS:2, partial [Entrophospora sp. SA101]